MSFFQDDSTPIQRAWDVTEWFKHYDSGGKFLGLCTQVVQIVLFETIIWKADEGMYFEGIVPFL